MPKRSANIQTYLGSRAYFKSNSVLGRIDNKTTPKG